MAVGNPLTPGGFIAGLIDTGVSATEGLRQLREAGLEIRTETFYRAWGEVQSQLAGTERITGLDPAALPASEDFTVTQMGRPGQLMYQVDVMARDIETGDITFRPWSVVSDTLLTPLEAMSQAEDEMSDGGDAYGEVVMGSVMRNIYQLGGGV